MSVFTGTTALAASAAVTLAAGLLAAPALADQPDDAAPIEYAQGAQAQAEHAPTEQGGAHHAAAHGKAHTSETRGPTYTYDSRYAKVKTLVQVHEANGRTMVALAVTRFPKSAAGKVFGVHVHENRCGRKPAAAGDHYQNPKAAPGTPLRKKEIWLDVKIGRDGKGHSRATVPWNVRQGVRSVVLHAKPTNPRTGDAGDRLLCTDTYFKGGR
jgi:Cu-Zn family superoxide dismutase